MTLRLDGKVRDFRLRTRMLHERHQHTLGGQFLADHVSTGTAFRG